MASHSPVDGPPRTELRPDPRRILVIRLSAMGDVLLTFPAVQALAARWPEARISYVTDRRWSDMLGGCSGVHEVLALDRLGLKRLRPGALVGLMARVLRPLAGRRWDLAVDMQCFSETALLCRASGARQRVGRHAKTRARWLYTDWVPQPHADCYMSKNHMATLRLAGVLDPTACEATALPEFQVSEAAVREWRGRVPAPRARRRIALFVGSAKPDKLWPAPAFIELGRRLMGERGADLELLVLAGPDQRRLTADVVAQLQREGPADSVIDGGVGSVSALAAGLRECAATVSNDTGPMHLSVAVGTPTLGLFRLRLPHFIPPPPHRHLVAPASGLMADLPVDTVERESRALLASHS